MEWYAVKGLRQMVAFMDAFRNDAYLRTTVLPFQDINPLAHLESSIAHWPEENPKNFTTLDRIVA